jgi:hypothetical protein
MTIVRAPLLLATTVVAEGEILHIIAAAEGEILLRNADAMVVEMSNVTCGEHSAHLSNAQPGKHSFNGNLISSVPNQNIRRRSGA